MHFRVPLFLFVAVAILAIWLAPGVASFVHKVFVSASAGSTEIKVYETDSAEAKALANQLFHRKTVLPKRDTVHSEAVDVP